MDRQFEQVLFAVYRELLLAVFDVGADAGRGQAAAESVTAAADTLCKGALGDELDIEFAGEHLILCYGVEADMGRLEASDTVVNYQPADALIGHTAGYGYGVNVFDVGFEETGYDLFGGKLAVPVAEQNGLTVLERRYGLLQCYDFILQLSSTFQLVIVISVLTPYLLIWP